MKLKHLSEITCSMTQEEQRDWEEAVEEAAPVLKKLLGVMNKKLDRIDKKMNLDTILSSKQDVTMTLLALQAERDALTAVIDLLE